ncbi:MAG: lysylphosphatidylglycerol synthase domain-containing protein [Actinomycetota bacterium]|nr:lysylphosphatidylglycerol synthase domain-containing protein [Actinomycetota bacterium]
MSAATPRRLLRLLGLTLGVALTVLAVAYLARVGNLRALAAAGRALLDDPAGLLLALGAYAGAFGMRTWAWRRVLPGLPAGHAWAALHVSLLGNHVLPMRLGEALRVTSVLRRTPLGTGPVLASAVVLRTGDVLAVLLLALATGPAVVLAVGGAWTWALIAVAVLMLAAGLLWLRAVGSAHFRDADAPGPSRRDRANTPPPPAEIARMPRLDVAAALLLAWLLEAAVVFEVARVSGVTLSPADAVAVTAVTIAAQTVAVTPGGFGTYEAAAAAAMTALGVDAGQAVAVAFVTHAVKTAYSLAVGAVALAVPAPSYFGRLRLPRRLPERPPPWPVGPEAPVVAMVPVHDEADTVAAVVTGLPRRVENRQVVALVVDDGSTDGSGALAAAAGARVVTQPGNLGLGAAVRRGLAEASAQRPAAVVYLDADLEYDPAELGRLAAPVLAGTADYVVGSRFAGDIRSMLVRRRLGNRVLTRWVRWMTRRRDVTDGQSGYRAFSPRAAAEAEVVHDYNYAQVLTLDLLAKGFLYAEVPISYAFRASGTSFVRLGRYLRKVVPAVYRELNAGPLRPPYRAR